MRVLRPVAEIAQTGPWTCRRCLRDRRKLVQSTNDATTSRNSIIGTVFTSRGFSSERTKTRPANNTILIGSPGNGPPPWKPQLNGLRLGVVLAALTAAGSLSVFSDTAQHSYAAAKRSLRVLSALSRNVRDYQVTLRRKEEEGDNRQATLGVCHKRCAERTLKAMEQNGSIFIKLGQHLSSMNYLLPEEWTTTFIPLQDHCPVSSYESIADLFMKDTGAPIEEYFEDFAREPIGAASLAQVHLATLKETGQKVAVKIQHPALEEWVPLDLSLTRLTFSTLKRFFPEYDLEWLSNEMEASLPQELDFALEGENALRTRDHFLGLPNLPLVVPNVMWGMKRILVMENVSGHRIDDLDYLDSHDIDRDEVSGALAHIFNEMIFGDTPLHCDPHGGNVAIRENKARRKPNFDIILYDHGLYRDIPKQLRRDYAKLWLAVIDADEKGMRRYAHDVAGIDDDQFPLFASAITGRDYTTVTKSVVSTRSEVEKEMISGSMGEGMLQQLVQLLAKVPPIILLILKTNDLTRSLDENLHTREGPVRNFMILARYCSKTVFQEQMEVIRQAGNILWPHNLFRFIAAWSSFMRVELKLSLYEYYISFRRFASLTPVANL